MTNNKTDSAAEQPPQVKYDMESDRFVREVTTTDEQILITPLDVADPVNHIIGVFDSREDIHDSDVVKLCGVPDTVVESPGEMMQKVISKGIEKCFNNPAYNDFAIMYADKHTDIIEN